MDCGPLPLSSDKLAHNRPLASPVGWNLVLGERALAHLTTCAWRLYKFYIATKELVEQLSFIHSLVVEIESSAGGDPFFSAPFGRTGCFRR